MNYIKARTLPPKVTGFYKKKKCTKLCVQIPAVAHSIFLHRYLLFGVYSRLLVLGQLLVWNVPVLLALEFLRHLYRNYEVRAQGGIIGIWYHFCLLQETSLSSRLGS